MVDIENIIKEKNSSWLSIKSSFVFDEDYLSEIGASEDIKKRIKNDQD